jgi:hypothetical protein
VRIRNHWQGIQQILSPCLGPIFPLALFRNRRAAAMLMRLTGPEELAARAMRHNLSGPGFYTCSPAASLKSDEHGTAITDQIQ